MKVRGEQRLDPKLSDRGARRGGCTGAKRRRRKQAGVTHGAVKGMQRIDGGGCFLIARSGRIDMRINLLCQVSMNGLTGVKVNLGLIRRPLTKAMPEQIDQLCLDSL